MQNQTAGRKPHILAIVLIASLGAVNMSILSPSLAAISRELDAPYAQVQLMLSGYMALTAVLQLVIGPMSDRYGRRPVLLASLAVFLLGTLVCMFATSIGTLLAGRMIQATVVAGLVLSRAIVRDIVPMNQAASMLGYVTMAMALAPMLAPVGGGYLSSLYGWQINFVVILAFGGFVTLAAFFLLPETNHQRSGSLSAQFKAWPDLLKNGRFWGYVLIATFGSGTYFTYLGGAPYVGGVYLKMGQTEMGYYFGIVSLGYIAGNFLSGRFAMSRGPTTMMLSGMLATILACLLPIALFEAGLESPASFFLPMLLLGLGNGMVLPSANAGMVDVRSDLAGSASGLGGAVTIGGGAILSIFGSAVLSPTSGPVPLLLVIVSCSLLGLVAVLYIRSVGDKAEEVNERPTGS